MSSLVDTRNNSAMFKRAEQLKRWEDSDTNRESTQPRLLAERKIKFSLGCVFLAACMAGDKDEVVRLIEMGADIDTANVDGLTALHQACIDDNLDMVEFLVEQGADINRADNEGWTPLHATSSCGFVSIARYLIDNGAELDLVNSDGELPIDLSASNSMENLLQQYIHERKINCEEARQKEEKLMLADAKKWLRSDAAEADKRHPRTGATALHVAAAKGYTKVLSLLLAGRANVDQQDNDGWTPLHAASHWGQLEAAQMLVQSLADLEVKNFAGQTAVDVADPDVVRYLDEMKKKKNKRRPGSQLRISDSLDINRESPAKVIRVDNNNKQEAKDDDKPKPPTTDAVASQDGQASEEDQHNSWRRSTRNNNNQQDKNAEKENQADSDVILRRTHSFESDEIFYQKLEELRARIKNNSTNSAKLTPPVVAPSGLNATTTKTTTTATGPKSTSTTTKSEGSGSGGGGGEANKTADGDQDQDESQSLLLGTNKLNNSNASNQINSVQRSASLKDHRAFRPNIVSSPPSSPAPQQQQPQSAVRRSFVPPVRDEESETQRKAHAKRVRETRRSTQGVTLDEIKSAEELVKKKNLNSNGAAATSDEASEKNQTPNEVAKDQVSVDHEVVLRRSPQQVAAATAPGGGKREETVSFTISSPPKKPEEQQPAMGGGSNHNPPDNRLSTSYTLPKRQSSSASASPVPFYKNHSMQNQHLPPLNFHAKVPSPTTSPQKATTDMDTSVSATLNLNEPSSLTSSPRHFGKKSLFDLDNANSLSLADKLRNEANKYTDMSASNKSLNMMEGAPGAERSKRELITGSTQSLTDNVILNHATAPRQIQYAERRPSWRLKFDAGSKFKLEDAAPGQESGPTVTAAAVVETTNTAPVTTVSGFVRRPTSLSSSAIGNSSAGATGSPITSPTSSTTTGITATLRPVSAPFLPHQSPSPTPPTTNAEATNERLSTASVVKTEEGTNNNDDKDNDKENDNRTGSGQSTQGVIQRRRRPKRRSTGVVHIDMDDLEGDRDSTADAEDKESGGEESRKSRLAEGTSSSAGKNNGEIIDYKALYEATKAENDVLRDQLQSKDEQLSTTKSALERFTNATTKNSLSELEKRERRAMERKMSEMEEELKQLEVLKTENQRLKDENGALIRVISKLSK